MTREEVLARRQDVIDTRAKYRAREATYEEMVAAAQRYIDAVVQRASLTGIRLRTRPTVGYILRAL